MTALFDLDIFLFRICCVPKDFIQQIEALEGWVEFISRKLMVEKSKLIVSGSNNFRYEVSSEYKSNRKKEKPRNFQELRDYAIRFMGAIEAVGEADDLIGILHDENSIIVSIDKDLLSLGGKYYNFVKDEFLEIEDGEKYFWIQMLCGDVTDGVRGVPNIYKSHHKTPPNFTWDYAMGLVDSWKKEERKSLVTEIYKFNFPTDWEQRFDTNAKLLWILREPNKMYYDHI